MTFPQVLLIISIALAVAGCNAVDSTHDSVAGWQSRCDKAKTLGAEDDRDSFDELLTLLLDEHGDVSYAASEAIEARGQVEYVHDLIRAIRKMPADRRWYAYKSLRAYPSKAALIFLADSLKDVINERMTSQMYDSQSSFYIIQSITEIIDRIEPR